MILKVGVVGCRIDWLARLTEMLRNVESLKSRAQKLRNAESSNRIFLPDTDNTV